MINISLKKRLVTVLIAFKTTKEATSRMVYAVPLVLVLAIRNCYKKCLIVIIFEI